MIDRLLEKSTNKKAPPRDQNQKSDLIVVGEEDPIMNSLQTRLKLEGIDLGMKGIGMVNIEGVDKSAIMKPHNTSNMNEIKDEFGNDSEYQPTMEALNKPSE